MVCEGLCKFMDVAHWFKKIKINKYCVNIAIMTAVNIPFTFIYLVCVYVIV